MPAGWVVGGDCVRIGAPYYETILDVYFQLPVRPLLPFPKNLGRRSFVWSAVSRLLETQRSGSRCGSGPIINKLSLITWDCPERRGWGRWRQRISQALAACALVHPFCSELLPGRVGLSALGRNDVPHNQQISLSRLQIARMCQIRIDSQPMVGSKLEGEDLSDVRQLPHPMRVIVLLQEY